jgi:cell division protein FtsW (lipid II flippase)/beta-lactamase class D
MSDWLRTALRALLAAAAILGVAFVLRARLATLPQPGDTVIDADTVVAAVLPLLPSDTTTRERAWYEARVRDAVATTLAAPPASRSLSSALSPSVDDSGERLPVETATRLADARSHGETSVEAVPEATRTAARHLLVADERGIRTGGEFLAEVDAGFASALCAWAFLLGVLVWKDLGARNVRGEVWVAVVCVATISLVGLTAQATVHGVGTALDVVRHARILALAVVLAVGGGATARPAWGLLAPHWARIATRPLPRRVLAALTPGALLLVVSLVAVSVLYVRALRADASDARVDLRLGGLGSFQPLELVKFTVVIALALYMAQFAAPADRVRRRFSQLLVPVFAAGLLVFTGFGLSDMGTVMVSLPAAAVVLFLALGLRATGTAIFFLGVSAAGILLPVSPALAPYLPGKFAGRLTMYADPWGNGYEDLRQVAQAAWAFAAGGLWGRPLSELDAADLPVREADMVFAWWVEGFGVVGGVVLVGAFAVLGVALVRLALNATEETSSKRFAALAVPVVLLAQVAVNVAAARGHLPLTGIVLPLVSAGGTSWFVFTVAIVGLLMLATRRDGARASETHAAAAVAVVLGGLATTGFCLALYGVCVTDSDEISVRPIVSSDHPFRAGSRGKVSLVQNPRLARLVAAVPPPDVLDREGRVVATGPAYARAYPYGAALVPILGVVRVDVNALGGTAEAVALRTHPVPSRPFDTFAGPQLDDDLRPLLPLLRADRAARAAAVAGLRAHLLPLRLVIDAELSATLYRAGERFRYYDVRGRKRKAALPALAVVVDDAATGERLAEVSMPAREPAEIGKQVFLTESHGEWGRIMDYARHPLCPGSTFKPYTSMAALEEGVDPATWRCVCDADSADPHLAELGGKCHNGHHGTLDLRGAHKVSCNACFAQLGERVGREDLHDFARRLPISRFDRAGKKSELSDAGFGQGNVELTASELTRAYAAIANGGSIPLCESLLRDPTGAPCPVVELADAEAAAEERILLGAVMEPGGTGTAALAPPEAPYTIVGKTGTAEAEKVDGEFFRREDGTPWSPGSRDHAWFAGIVSTGRRAYAVTVVAPRAGGFGGDVAAPLLPVVAEALDGEGYLGRSRRD